MDKESTKVRFVSKDEQTFLPLPRFVTRREARDLMDADLLDEDPLEPDAPGVDAPGVDPAAPPTTA